MTGTGRDRPLRPSSEAEYREWIARHEADLHPPPSQALRARPLVSIMIRGDRSAAATRAALAAQSYAEWELVPALEDASGTFVGILEAGDVPAPDALARFATVLDGAPETDIVYADDDLRAGRDGADRASPRFRTEWDPDLVLAGDALGGLVLYRRTLLDRIGAADAWHDGYRLALAATRATTPDRIRHLPQVLCHLARRRSPGAPTVAAAQSHLDAIAPGARASLCGNRQRVVWPIPDPAPLVTVIVPTRDRADLLARCADGVLRQTEYPAIELLVVDNDSKEADARALLDRLSGDARCRVLRAGGAFDHSSMNNRAAREARGTVLVLLNNDVEILHGDWLRELVSQVSRPDVGAVGARLLTRDGRLQHGGVTMAPGPIVKHVLDGAAGDASGWDDRLAVVREYSAVTAACMAIRRNVWREVGGFDASAFPTSYNDVDLCFRIGAHGYRVIWTPFATLTHHGSASRARLVTDAAIRADDADLRRLWRRWSREIETDPFSHPALRLFDTVEALLVGSERRT